MEFRSYATREASTLVGRLVDGVAEKSARDLQAIRDALDMVGEAVEKVLATRSAPDYSDDVDALVERLAKQATAISDAASEQARQDADAAADELRQQLSARKTECDDLSAQVAKAQSEIELLRLELDSQSKAGQSAREQATRNEEATAELRAQLAAARHSIEERQRACRALETKLEAAASAAASARQRLEAAERETARVRGEAELVAQSSVRAARALQEAEAHADRRLHEQTAQVRRHATTFLSVSLDRLIGMYVSVASGATVDTVLTAVVEAIALQFSRVALFRVQGNHLEGVRQVGFDLREDISQVLIPRTMNALINDAVTSTRIETRSAEQLADTAGTPFGGSADFALALPLVIDGLPLAVVYADDSDQPHGEFADADVRVKYAQLLQAHAVPLLTRLCADASAIAELDEYASLLVQELEHTYGSQIGSGAPMPDAERRERLRENIEYARQLYAQRAGGQGTPAARLFEQRLLGAIDARHDTVFGRDLAALVSDADVVMNGEATADAAPSAQPRRAGAEG